MLKLVRILDVSNNSITRIENSLDGLGSLPKLTHLSIDVESAEDKAKIAKACAKLEFLNGEEIVR